DEAQDIPRRLVPAMCRFSKYLLAFADPLQRHVDDGSSIEELVDALEHDHPWPVFVLEEDFRTTREIQRFATAAWAPERSYPSRSARNHGPDPQVVAGSFVDVAQEAARLLDAGGATVLVASDHAD